MSPTEVIWGHLAQSNKVINIVYIRNKHENQIFCI